MRVSGYVIILTITLTPILLFRLGKLRSLNPPPITYIPFVEELRGKAPVLLAFLAGVAVSSQAFANAVLWLFHPAIRHEMKRRLACCRKYKRVITSSAENAPL